jgi:hypothetical protein
MFQWLPKSSMAGSGDNSFSAKRYRLQVPFCASVSGGKNPVPNSNRVCGLQECASLLQGRSGFGSIGSMTLAAQDEPIVRDQVPSSR